MAIFECPDNVHNSRYPVCQGAMRNIHTRSGLIWCFSICQGQYSPIWNTKEVFRKEGCIQRHQRPPMIIINCLGLPQATVDKHKTLSTARVLSWKTEWSQKTRGHLGKTNWSLSATKTLWRLPGVITVKTWLLRNSMVLFNKPLITQEIKDVPSNTRALS